MPRRPAFAVHEPREHDRGDVAAHEPPDRRERARELGGAPDEIVRRERSPRGFEPRRQRGSARFDSLGHPGGGAQLGRVGVGRPEARRQRAALAGDLGEVGVDVGEQVVSLVGVEVGQRGGDAREVGGDLDVVDRHACTSTCVASRLSMVVANSLQVTTELRSWSRPRSLIP